MIDPPDFQVGDELTVAAMNARDEARRAGTVSASPGSGLSAIGGPDGFNLRVDRSPDGWFRVTATSSPAGYYQLTKLVATPGGGFAVGPDPAAPKVVSGREANLNPSVPVGATAGAIVRGYRDKLGWWFLYGACA